MDPGQSSSDSSEPSQPIESAFPDEDEDTITMLDVIEREDKLEEEASAVLGNSDEKNCTYPKGYVSRQALYSCATCSDGPDKVAAICLACSLECHENHEVYELYTKRNYRCDCGNSKFKPDFVCKLLDKQTKKLPLNENNKYNHNFLGKYCVCDERFPPDEADDSVESNDEMWQCIVCEDWYHTKHLGAKELPAKFEEMICGTCVKELNFVHYYKSIDTGTDEGNLDKSDVTEPIQANSECLLEKLQKLPVPTMESSQDNGQLKNEDQLSAGPIFWTNCDWRAKLCRCLNCIVMYKEKKCEFLLDDKDTVQYYEAQGKALAKDSQTPFERGMTALNRMNRAAVVEALHGYDELKADLSSYLKKFADTKKVVREEDIHDFFTQLRSKKKPRFEGT